MISKLTCKAHITEVAFSLVREDEPTPPLAVCLDLMFPMTVNLQGAGSTLEKLLGDDPVQITIERIEK